MSASGNIRDDYNHTYQAAAAADVVVNAAPTYLHKIIIGADVASSVIELSNHISDGDGAVIVKLTGSALMTATGGEVVVNTKLSDGLTADLTNQTDVTFIWR